MAVEFRNLLKTELGLERAVSATIVFDYPTVDALTEYVGCTLFGWPSQKAAPAPKAAPVEMDLLDSLESLSSAEAEQLLASRIGGGR